MNMLRKRNPHPCSPRERGGVSSRPTHWVLAAVALLAPAAALAQPPPPPGWVGIVRYEAWEGYYPTEDLNTNTGERTPFNAHVLRARVVMRIRGPERTTMKVVFLEPTNWTEPIVTNDDLILVELRAPRNGRFGEGGSGFPAEMGVQYIEMRDRIILPPGGYVREGNTPEKNLASIYAQAYERSRGSSEFLGLGGAKREGANADYDQFAEQVLMPRLRRGAEGNPAKEFEVESRWLRLQWGVFYRRNDQEGMDEVRRQYMARILEVDQAWPEDRRANFDLNTWFDPRSGLYRDEDRDFLLRLAQGARNTLLRIQAIRVFENDPDFVPLLIPLLDDPNPQIVIATVNVLNPVKNYPQWKDKHVPIPIRNENGGIDNLEEIKRAWKSG